MHDGVLEIAGFACRWCLFALAGAVVIAGSWTGLAGVGFAPRASRRSVVAVDRMCEQFDGGPINVPLHHVESPAARGATHVMVSLPDGSQGADSSRRGDRSRVWVRRGLPGRVALRFVGHPYGPLAFEHAAAAVVIVPPGRRRFIVDARAPLAAAGAEALAWRGCLEQLARAGSVAFLFVGPIGDYRAARARLGLIAAGAAVEYAGRDDSTVCTRLWRIRLALNPTGEKTRPLPSLVTSRPALAVLTGSRGYPTHLIAPGQTPIAGARYVERHASVVEFAGHIAVGSSPPGAGR